MGASAFASDDHRSIDHHQRDLALRIDMHGGTSRKSAILYSSRTLQELGRVRDGFLVTLYNMGAPVETLMYGEERLSDCHFQC